MPIDLATIQEALNVLRETYDEECHLAAESLVTRVRRGEIVTDESLWDALLETHITRTNGSAVTPPWTPILLSPYRFDVPATWPVQIGKSRLESDVLWEYNRLAWVHDICHVLAEHYEMMVAGMTREKFVDGHPLDSLIDDDEVIRRAAQELRSTTGHINDIQLRTKILREVTRLESVTRRINPSLSGSTGRWKKQEHTDEASP